jgi:hypothetical protein
MTDYDDDHDHLLPEYRDYIDRFGDVGAALAAARRGEDASLYLPSDGLSNLMTVTPSPDGPGGLVEWVYYLEYSDALGTAVMNALADGTPDTDAIVGAAASWVQQAVVSGIETPPGRSLETVILADGEFVDDEGYHPLLAVRERVPVTGAEGWESLDSGAYAELASFSESAAVGRDRADFVRSLVSAGARVVKCSECGAFLTNGVADFPGVWFRPHEENAAECGRWFWPPSPHVPTPWQDSGDVAERPEAP